MEANELKKRLGLRAVDDLVRDSMKLGLGTGSTAIEVIKRIGELRKKGQLRNIICVATSLQTEVACMELGIPLHSLNDPLVDGVLDLTIDGADEIDSEWNATKGGGGAHLVEKIVASNSRSYAIIIDSRKRVSNLGLKFPIPVEVFPFAYVPVARKLSALGGRVILRNGDKIAGPAITRQGNIILDVTFGKAFDPKDMEREINMIPGVVDNGIFTIQITDLLIGNPDGNIEHLTKDQKKAAR